MRPPASAGVSLARAIVEATNKGYGSAELAVTGRALQRALRIIGDSPHEVLSRDDFERLAIAGPLIPLFRWARAVGLDRFAAVLNCILIAVAGSTDHAPAGAVDAN